MMVGVQFCQFINDEVMLPSGLWKAVMEESSNDFKRPNESHTKEEL